jgi:regulator of RNase E activity RraA
LACRAVPPRLSEACHVNISRGGVAVKQGYRLIIVDKDGVLVSEFQLTEIALAQPGAFVEALKQSIDHVEEEDP